MLRKQNMDKQLAKSLFSDNDNYRLFAQSLPIIGDLAIE
jgi:hypothetical protein